MKIEIVNQVHNFQRRLCWNICSLLNTPPDIDITLSLWAMEDNGTPSTEEVVEFYKKYQSDNFKIKLHTYKESEKDRFAHRGYTRNDAVKALDEDTDWVLFSDTDMVYAGSFFTELALHLKKYKDVVMNGKEPFIAVTRLSNDKDEMNDIVNAMTYPTMFDPAKTMRKVKCHEMRNVGAGFFQLVQKKSLDGYFVPEGTSRDKHMFKKGSNPKSDIQFRNRFHVIKLKLQSTQWHLNHNRDPDVKGHLEEQR